MTSTDPVENAAEEPRSRSGLARAAAATGLTMALLAPIPAASASTAENPDESTASEPTEAPEDPEGTNGVPEGDDAPSEGESEAPQEGEDSDEEATPSPTAEEAAPEDDEDSSASDEEEEAVSEESDETGEDEATEETNEEAELQQEDEATSEEGVVDLQILSTNDFHGRLEQNGIVAGASVLKCTVDHYRGQNENTLFVGAGDHIGASTFTSFIQDDEPTIEALNMMELDVTSVGNHEFDQGQNDLYDRVMPLSNFNWLGANVQDSSGNPLIDPYEIHTLDGVDVGFIGLNTTDMPRLVSPDGIEGIEWANLSETANHYAEVLTEEEGADVVVVLVHEGIPGTELSDAAGLPFGELVDNAHPAIDAIISGHTHREYVLQTEDGTWVTQAGEYGEALGQLNISYDTEAGEIVSSEAGLIHPIDRETEEPTYCAGDPEVDALVADAVEVAEELGSVVVGEAATDFTRAQNPDGSENRSALSTLSNQIADVQAWAARQSNPDVEFAIMNPGGVRADLSAGEITYRDLATVQPFANVINRSEVTGAQIRETLELQWRDGRDLMLGVSEEFNYTYDPSQPYGERVQTMWLNGEEIQDDETYVVALNSFLAAGGDGFTPLGEAPSSSTGQTDLEAFTAYAEEHGTIEPSLPLRAVGVTWEGDPAETYAPGDEIALDISGFAYSSEAVEAGEAVDTRLGTIGTGEFELDLDYVTDSNDRGQAEVRVEVPEALEFSGELNPGLGAMSVAENGEAELEVSLVIEEEATGTELVLPVTVLSSAAGGPDTDPTDEPTDEPTDPSESPSPSPEPTDEPSTTPNGGADGTGPAAGSDSASKTGGPLANTGAQALFAGGLALLLLTVGALLVLRARSRKELNS